MNVIRQVVFARISGIHAVVRVDDTVHIARALHITTYAGKRMMLPFVDLMQFVTELTMAPNTLQRTLSECKKCSPRAISMAMRWPTPYQPRCRPPLSYGCAAMRRN